MNYEPHPLSSLFHRMVGTEFSAMTRFSGVRADGIRGEWFSAEVLDSKDV
jgi:hypothetical protein